MKASFHVTLRTSPYSKVTATNPTNPKMITGLFFTRSMGLGPSSFRSIRQVSQQDVSRFFVKLLSSRDGGSQIPLSALQQRPLLGTGQLRIYKPLPFSQGHSLPPLFFQSYRLYSSQEVQREQKSDKQADLSITPQSKSKEGVVIGVIILIVLAILFGKERKDPTPNLSSEPSELEKAICKFVQEFNQNYPKSAELKKQYLEEALLKLEDIKYLGGLAQKSNPLIDISLARICFVEIAQCADVHIQLEALDHLTQLLRTGENPFTTLHELEVLENRLGESLAKANIHDYSPPILEQTVKAYVLVLEHLNIYLLQSQGKINFANRLEAITRSKTIRDKLSSPSFQYHAACIDSLSSQLQYHSRPVQNSITVSIEFLKQIREPGSRLSQFLAENGEVLLSLLKSGMTVQQWLKDNPNLLQDLSAKDLQQLEDLVSAMTQVGESGINFFERIREIWKTPDKKQHWYQKLFLYKTLWSLLPHDPANLKAIRQMIERECQSQEDWLLFYGAIDLLSEVALSSSEKLGIRKEALSHIISLLNHPYRTSAVTYKIGETLFLLQNSTIDTLEQQAKEAEIENKGKFLDVTTALAWFQKVQEKRTELYQQIEAWRKGLSATGRLPSFLSPMSSAIYKDLFLALPDTTQYFIERKVNLEEIARGFRPPSVQNNHTLTQVITGLGGVGKTQLALDYAHHYARDYRFVHWIKASTIEQLKADLDRLAKILVPKEENRLLALKTWLEKSENAGWLLVFDNLDKIQDTAFLSELKKYFPASGGHILIASRVTDLKSWEALSPSLSLRPLDPFSLNQSIQYFKEAALSPYEESDTKTLVLELGHLPLALAQAVGFLRTYPHVNLKGYLQRFNEQKEKLLKDNYLRSEEYPESLATTWLINIDEIRRHPQAAKVLMLCAYLNPEEISISLLNRWMWYCQTKAQDTHLSQPAIHPELDQALKMLINYSMLSSQKEKESIAIHRLVQMITRGYFQHNNSSKQLSLLEDFIPFLIQLSEVKEYNPTHSTTLHPFRQVLPHCVAIVDHLKGSSPSPLKIRLVLTMIRYWIETEHNLALAEKYLKEIDAWTKPMQHPVRGRVFFFYGLLNNKKAILEQDPALQQQLRKGAAAYFEKAREVFSQCPHRKEYVDLEHNPAKCSPEYQKAISLEYQAQTYLDLNLLDQASDKLDEAMEEFKQLYSHGKHFDTARILREQGRVLMKRGEYLKAEERVKEALTMQEAVYEKGFSSHPAVAATYTVLGDIYFGMQTLADWKEADTAYHKAIVTNEKAYTAEYHPYNIRLYKKRALVAEKLGEKDKAEEMKKKALEIEKYLSQKGI